MSFASVLSRKMNKKRATLLKIARLRSRALGRFPVCPHRQLYQGNTSVRSNILAGSGGAMSSLGYRLNEALFEHS